METNMQTLITVLGMAAGFLINWGAMKKGFAALESRVGNVENKLDGQVNVQTDMRIGCAEKHADVITREELKDVWGKIGEIDNRAREAHRRLSDKFGGDS